MDEFAIKKLKESGIFQQSTSKSKVSKDMTVHFMYEGSEESEDIPDMMSVGRACGYLENMLGSYASSEQRSALYSIMADGDVEKYKKLWIDYLRGY